MRNGTDWCNITQTSLKKEDIDRFYNQLRNTLPTIRQPYTEEVINPDMHIDNDDILHTITIKK